MGLEAIFGWAGAFFGAGTLVALTLCASSADSDLRFRRAMRNDAETLAREAEDDELISL